MEILVTYDVETTKPAGRKRLRKVAKVCEAHGQRVQQSVFECILNEAQRELFVNSLIQIIDKDKDSLRIYRLPQPREGAVEIFGKPLALDIRETMIV